MTFVIAMIFIHVLFSSEKWTLEKVDEFDIIDHNFSTLIF